MPVSQLVFIGDSITAGGSLTAPFSPFSQGGLGSWADLVADRLANINGLGPLLSSGAINFWGLTTGSWSDTVGTDPFDKAPYSRASYTSGIGNLATANKPYQRTVVGFALYWTDYTSGGNWQYSIDGGAYTNMGQTIAHDNGMKKFYVATPVKSRVVLRGYDGTADCGLLPNFIEWFYLDPTTTTQGLIVHNLGQGGTDLHDLVATTSGDRMAFFDSVTLGTGSPITNRPNVGVVIEHLNDAKDIGNTTTYATDLTTFYNRVSPRGPVGFWNVYEDNPAFYDVTVQANYRAQLKSTGASLGAQVLDIYDYFSGKGIVGYAAEVAAGLIHAADGLHPSQLGTYELADRLYWFIVTKILSLSNLVISRPVSGKIATRAIAGKKATVAYAGGPRASII